MSDSGQFARLVAKVDELQAALDAEQAAHTGTRQQLAAVETRVAELQHRADAGAAASAELAELRANYLRPPPQGSGIATVAGYVTSDFRPDNYGHHSTLPAAQRHAAALGLMQDLGITLEQAKTIVAKSDGVVKHLSVIGQPPPA